MPADATWRDWLTLFGVVAAFLAVVVPLCGLAWAAVFYTIAHRREVRHQEFERVFKVMDHLGQNGGSIASKMAAAYELRRYPQYRDVIVRMCEQTEVEGSSAGMLKSEMMLTAEFLRKKQNG
ncbi:MAG: hypothetical protein K2X68_00655 [Novosphingobium sp.]|nr:hypothetical protein [Novosphingobium sp.]